MDSLYAIGLGLGLRILIDAVTRNNPRLDGVLIGLWEGAVLNHFLWKYPTSTDPYVGFVFRLFVDFAVTKDFARLTVVVLWTGLGLVLCDVLPDVYRDKRFRKLTRPFRRWLAHPHLDFATLPSLGTSSRVRFRSEPPSSHHTVSESSIARSPTQRASTHRPSRSRPHVPGFYQSETDTTVTNHTSASVGSNTTSPAQIIPPFNQPPRTRQIVSPGPSILSNRSVRQSVSPTSHIHQVISPSPSAPSTAIISPPPPTQLPLSPPHLSPQASSQELEYEDNLPPPTDIVVNEREPLVSSPEAMHTSSLPDPQLFHQQSHAVNQPPLEDIPELDPEEVGLPSSEKYLDDMDPLTTPPGLPKGIYATDDIDQLTTPPVLAMPMPRIDISQDRPPSYHFLPFTSAYDEFPPPSAQLPEIPETIGLMQGGSVNVASIDRKQENPEISSDVKVIVDNQSNPDGVPTEGAASGDASIQGGQSMRTDLQTDVAFVEESVKLRKGVSTKSLSLRESIRESLWGAGSTKEDPPETGSTKAQREPSFKASMSEKGADDAMKPHSGSDKRLIAPHLNIDPADLRSMLSSDSDDSIIPAGQSKQTILEDAKNYRKQAEEQEKIRTNLLNEKKAAESHRLPQKALSLKVQADKADKEATKLHDKAIKRIVHVNNKDAPPYTSNMEGLKIEEAARETEKAYHKALEEGATQLNILCGSGKPGLNVKRRLVRLLEEEYHLSLSSSTDPRRLIVPLPNVPPVFTDEPEP